jgi:hypothetical protein
MRAYEESVWTGQGSVDYCSRMPKPDPEALAAALRENLRKRKVQARGGRDDIASPNSDLETAPRTRTS